MNREPPDHVDEHAGPGGIGERLAPYVVLIVAALVRLHGLGSRSLWTDEGSTWTAASLPFRELLRRCVERDASPPLYYMLTSWALRFGDDEAHLRGVSAFASVALVWLSYRLARLGLSRRAAAFAALLTALSPFQVMYAQEARTYTMVAALLVGATYAYARFVISGRRAPWVAHVLLTAAGLWTQSIAALGFAGQGAFALLTPEGRRRFWPWLAAVLTAGLLYVPWLLYGRGVADRLSSSHWYIPDPDALGIFKLLRAALLSPLPLVTAPGGSLHPGLDHWLPRSLAWVLVAVPPIAALTLTVTALFGTGRRASLTRLGWFAWLVPVMAVYAVSLHRPLFLARYFVFVTPFLSVLFALGVCRIKPRPLRALAAAWLVALALLGLARYEQDYTKEPWRDVAADLRTHAWSGRAAVLVPFDVDPMNFYLRDGHSGVRAFEVSHPDEPFAAHFTPRQLDEIEAFARRDVRPFDDVWVVVRSPNSEVRREVARRAEAVAAEGRTLIERRTWTSLTGPLRVTRFVRDTLGTRP